MDDISTDSVAEGEKVPMQVRRFPEAKPYVAPNHRDCTALRLVLFAGEVFAVKHLRSLCERAENFEGFPRPGQEFRSSFRRAGWRLAGPAAHGYVQRG